MSTINITRATIREPLKITDHCTHVLTRGDTRTLPIVIDGRTYYREPCTLDDCPNPIAVLTLGLCRSHYYRQKRWGDPRITPARGRPNAPSGPAHPSYKPIVGYSAAHYRIRALKGLANQHPCVDCG